MSNSIIIKRGPLRDLLRFIAPITERRRRMRRAPKTKPTECCINSLAQALHPLSQNLVIAEIRKESPSTRTYVLKPAHDDTEPAPFRAGQYLSVEVDTHDGHGISRPYSLSGTPNESEKENAYRITVRTDESPFIAGLIGREWTVGTSVKTSAPQGFFTYEPLRDSPLLICIAGGSGVTPFRSIIGDLLDDTESDVHIVLIQGSRTSEELLFDADFRQWEKIHSDRFGRICVLSENRYAPPSPQDSGRSENPNAEQSCRRGFITADILADAMEEKEATFFICGPEAMHTHLNKEIASLKNKPRRIRREDYGQSGKRTEEAAKKLTVRIPGRSEITIPADPGETVLVAMERAGLNPPSFCRTGTCGWCRSLLVQGDVDYISEPAGVRRRDKELGYFHPCIAKARTDIIVEMPEKPARRKE